MMTLAETYEAHKVTRDSAFADIFDAALEYYTNKHRASYGSPDESDLLEIESRADAAASRFAR